MRDMNIEDAVIDLRKKVDAMGEELRRLRAELSAMAARAAEPKDETKDDKGLPQGQGGQGDDNEEPDPVQSE